MNNQKVTYSSVVQSHTPAVRLILPATSSPLVSRDVVRTMSDLSDANLYMVKAARECVGESLKKVVLLIALIIVAFDFLAVFIVCSF